MAAQCRGSRRAYDVAQLHRFGAVNFSSHLDIVKIMVGGASV